MTAPERIWAWQWQTVPMGQWGITASPSSVEYVRSDLHDATECKLAKAVAALRITLEWMETMRACGDAGNWEWGDGDEYTTARAVLAEIEKGGV